MFPSADPAGVKAAERQPTEFLACPRLDNPVEAGKPLAGLLRMAALDALQAPQTPVIGADRETFSLSEDHRAVSSGEG